MRITGLVLDALSPPPMWNRFTNALSSRLRIEERLGTALLLRSSMLTTVGVITTTLLAVLFAARVHGPITEMRKTEIHLVEQRVVTHSPPSITAVTDAPPAYRPATSLPPAAIPDPVPFEDAERATIADQDQMPFAGALSDTGFGDGEGGIGVPWGVVGGTGGLEVAKEFLPAPDEFVPYEVAPRHVRGPNPHYPSLAREAGIEELVTIRVLVGVDGKVRDARVGICKNEVFRDVSLAAARQHIFTPALQNNHPVAVWVAVPFNFHLH